MIHRLPSTGGRRVDHFKKDITFKRTHGESKGEGPPGGGIKPSRPLVVHQAKRPSRGIRIPPRGEEEDPDGRNHQEGIITSCLRIKSPFFKGVVFKSGLPPHRLQIAGRKGIPEIDPPSSRRQDPISIHIVGNPALGIGLQIVSNAKTEREKKQAPPTIFWIRAIRRKNSARSTKADRLRTRSVQLSNSNGPPPIASRIPSESPPTLTTP